jgi:hypothetical protein
MKRIWSRILLGAALVGAVLALSAVPQPADARICPPILAPVCAVNPDGTRQTYSSPCIARLHHAKVLHRGKCLGPVCNMLWMPVCARNPVTKLPQTFSSLCWAEVHNAVFLYNGACH